jgi:hypothetical protein
MLANFTAQFVAARKTLKAETFAAEWAALVGSAKKLLGDDGLDAAYEATLREVRKQVARLGHRVLKEDEGILFATGDYNPGTGQLCSEISSKTGDKAATVKFLRHLYMLRMSGGHRLWLCALPNSYRDWPHDEMTGGALPALRGKLGDVSERFSAEDKKHLANATQQALRWCHKTLISLAAAKEGANKDRAIVRRWFADEKATDAEIDAMISTLTAGFKRMTGVVRSGGLILTDHPCYRGHKLEQVEAFVIAGRHRDRLDVIYIENDFFSTRKLLSGLTDWTRVLVHELSHREMDTQDWPGKYAWGGIKPNLATFPSAKAITNADSWAWYCADVAGELTQKNLNDALRVA